jgi:molybdopterin/thiamine biosynthesis adenylyltransferase
MGAAGWSYSEATSRNIGMVEKSEQEVLRNATVGIAGVGAVGGNYLLTLARMGIGGFVIADPDSFEPVNLQRQVGAFTHTLGRGKAEVMAEMVRGINPEIRIRFIPRPFGEDNAEEFFQGVDLALDGIDFFQIDARRLYFQKAREKGIFAMTSAPIGYGASLQIFDPRGMTFDEYFGIGSGMTRAERMVAFGAGLLPPMPWIWALRTAFKTLRGAVLPNNLPTGALMDRQQVDFENHRVPALASAMALASGIVAPEVLRILLQRGRPRCVPHASYFDSYSGEHVRTCLRLGRTGLRDRIVRRIGMHMYPGLLTLHGREMAERLTPAAAR